VIPQKLSIVVPVYNSEETLSLLCDRVEAAMQSLGREYELILVDDASRDDSWAQIKKITSGKKKIRGIRLCRNFGQHNALLCGIRAARYEIIATIDDDLQNPPEEIEKLIHKLGEGYDVVYGVPEMEQHGFFRDIASMITKLAIQVNMDEKAVRQVSAFRVFRTKLRDSFSDFNSPTLSIDVLLFWGTSKFGSMKVRHDPRRHGQSNYTFPKLVAHATKMITGFSVLPLRITSWFGFAFTFFGLMSLVFVVFRFMIQGTQVSGFTFLASIVSIFSGATMFALGIIGEYLAQVHLRVMGKPVFAESDRTFGENEDIAAQDDGV